MLLHGDITIPSDFTVCSETLSRGIGRILDSEAPLFKNHVHISYIGDIELSAGARTAVESLLSSCGFIIVPEADGADHRLRLTVTDVRIILDSRRSPCTRYLTMTIHLHCFDKDGKGVFAAGVTEINSDTIPHAHLASTVDSSHFSPNVQRIVLTKTHNRFRFWSLAVITGALCYFAFR